LSELLRLIQFYNSLGYHYCPVAGTEDGFCPGVAELQVSALIHHFGIDVGTADYETSWGFDVFRTTDGPSTAFFVTASEPWIGISASSLSSTGPADRATVTVTIDRTYSETKGLLDFSSGEIYVQSQGSYSEIQITVAPDYFTDIIVGGGELASKAFLFVPGNGPSFYEEGVALKNIFPVTPTGTTLSFAVDLVQKVSAPTGKKYPFYGVEYDSIYVSSDGVVGFGVPGNTPTTFGDHFAHPQISLLPIAAANAVITFSDDYCAITYAAAGTAGAPEFPLNDIQLTIFYDGKLLLSFVHVDPAIAGIVGLSVGNGQNGVPPSDFLASNLLDAPIVDLPL
jgi:hypothetical protein